MSPFLVAFGRALRRAGLRVTTQRIVLFVEALGHIGAADARALHDAARATLVSRHDELELFETVFAEFWGQGAPAPHAPAAPSAPEQKTAGLESGPAFDASGATSDSSSDAASDPAAGQPWAVERRAAWSAVEVLRNKRFDELNAEEGQRVRALMQDVAWRLDERRTLRFRRAPHGSHLDWRRMVARAVRDQGEWLERRWRVRQTTPRPLVVIADISGSMDSYSRLLLCFLHGLSRGISRETGHRVESFVFSTRLTRVTRALQGRDTDRALAEVARSVADWAGGTRIGDCLRAFNLRWARRTLGRGAIVLIVSDGWDRGDPAVLAREVHRLRASCHRLIWLNPLVGTERYEPSTRGLRAALPFVDDFLPVSSLASLDDLALRLADLPPQRHVHAPSPRQATS